MANDTTSFDKRKEQKLSKYEKLMLYVIEIMQRKHKNVFPSYPTLADKGGMSVSKAISVIKDLVKWGYITKKKRFRKLPNGRRKQLTNVYKLCPWYLKESYPQKKSRTPYGLSSKSNKKEEYNNTLTHTPTHVNYETYVNGMKKAGVPEPKYKSALRKLGNLVNYSVTAFEQALKEVEKRYFTGEIRVFSKWFHMVLFNKNLGVKVYPDDLIC